MKRTILIAISLAAILPIAVSFAQTVSFSPATNFPVGTFPLSLAIGDFNGDGNPDLATANRLSHNVSILLGDGAGSFGSATNFRTGSFPFSLAIGDLNGDGNPDLAVTNEGDDLSNLYKVSILLGDGTGSFGSATNFSVGAFPLSVAIGDFNGDGNPDLVTANQTEIGFVSILLGDGTGSFGSATNFSTGPFSRFVAIGDLNGDGNPDLAVASALGNGGVWILLGDGTGSFGPATNFSAGGFFTTSLAIGDLNGDGKPDLAVTSQTSTVSVLLGDGTGSFGSATHFSIGDFSLSFSVEIGDLNGDGKPDLAVTNSATLNVPNSTVSVLLGDGTGSFGPATQFGVGMGPLSVAIGDFNGDGKPDLATANFNDSTISILLNTSVFATPAQAIQNLIAAINNMGLPAGVANSLSAPLGQASALLNDNNPNNDIAVCGKLDAFINEVNAKAQSGKLTLIQAGQLLQEANVIKVSLGCP